MAERGNDVMAGPRMDRLPMTRMHYRSFMLLVGGSFFDGFDMYLAGGVLAAMAATGFSSVTGNAAFIPSRSSDYISVRCLQDISEINTDVNLR